MEKEDFLIQIRDKLRKDGIKLWLPPYYSQTTGISELEIIVRSFIPFVCNIRSMQLFQNLSKTVSEALNISQATCLEIVKELQTNSVENLKQKTRFEESGLATLKIKVVNQGKAPKILTKEVMLTLRGSDLKDVICQDISVPSEK